MPKPEGFTEEQGKKRDEIARALLRDRHFTGRGTMDRRQRAHAIATAQVKEVENPHNPGNPHVRFSVSISAVADEETIRQKGDAGSYAEWLRDRLEAFIKANDIDGRVSNVSSDWFVGEKP